MAKTINITHKTSMDAADFREAINDIFSTLKSMYKIDGSWKSGTLYLLSGDNIGGFVALIDGYVEVSLVLGMLLVPFAGTIETMVTTALKDRLK